MEAEQAMQKNKNICNSLVALHNQSKCNAVDNSEKVVHPWSRPGVSKLFAWRATFLKMLQPTATHSHYKVGKFFQCINNNIYYKQCLYFTLGVFNAIYTVIVRTETNCFHKILSFYENVTVS